MPSVSIIIPTFNEEKVLPRTLRLLQGLYPEPLEIIVVDGGPTDRTLQLADAARPRFRSLSIIRCPQPGRARQMNAGAANATGDILCFLHADTSLPDDARRVVQRQSSGESAHGRFSARRQ